LAIWPLFGDTELSIADSLFAHAPRQKSPLLVDGDSGSASYEADFPNGGNVTLVGNVLGQSKTTENLTMLAYLFR